MRSAAVSDPGRDFRQRSIFLGAPRELCSNGESRGLGRPLISGAVSAIAIQVPIASAKLLLFWHLPNSSPGIGNGMSGPLLQRIRFPFANRRRETQKITSVKNTKFCKYEVETIAGTRRLQNQLPHTCFFIGPLRGKISSPFAAYVSIFSP